MSEWGKYVKDCHREQLSASGRKHVELEVKIEDKQKLSLLKILWLAQKPLRVSARTEIMNPHSIVEAYREALEAIEKLARGEIK